MFTELDSLLLAQTPTRTTVLLMQHLPWMIFVFCFGAAVGSFINVVNYRLPAGISVISPPSRCPVCGKRLGFFSENLPIIGWLLIRGKCRGCGVRVSPEYMIVELLMAMVFVGLYVLLYIVPNGTPWLGGVFGPWWHLNGFWPTFPAYFVLAFLIASLISMTMIDARTFTIPIQIPVFVIVTAFLLYPLQIALPHRASRDMDWPIPGADWFWSLAAVGGMLGVLIGVALLRSGRLSYSFADYDEYLKEGEVLAEYPHARREMWVELKFLSPCLAGIILGAFIGSRLPGVPPPLIQSLTASILGYLVGAGMIWGMRIIGSLIAGREAIGLGDVHLLGAIGAVLGWVDPLFVFFIAPFSGIAWAVVSMRLGRIFRGLRRELPYGPHLALATLIVIFCRPGIELLWNNSMKNVPLPQPGFVVPPPPPPTP